MLAASKSNKLELELVMRVLVRAMLDPWLGKLISKKII